MTSVLPILVGVVVLVAAGAVVMYTFRGSRSTPPRNDYLHALEHWIEGDLDEAANLLHRVVHDDPDAFEPFLHLGNLLRLQGDPGKAAVLHRGLTVRPDLSRAQKIAVGESLAADLNALGQFAAAGEVLDHLGKDAFARTGYWKARFAAWNGLGKLPEAARTLRDAPRHVREADRDWFRQAYAGFQLDRALAHALVGEGGEANARIKDVKNIDGTEPRAALVRAILAVVQNDAPRAVELASEGLLNHPEELGIFLPLLQEILLGTGQFSRTVPILERSCQAENAPPSLWVDLALLYEKVGDRDKAMRFLETKAGRPSFTPDAAAPYLRQLVADAPDTDFARLWRMLAMPVAPRGWTCQDCGRKDERVRWFCPACRGFHTYLPGSPDTAEA